MFYLDTSVAVALLTPEKHTARAHQIIDQLMLAGIKGACSEWTRAEFRCAISAKFRADLILLQDLDEVAKSLDVLTAKKMISAPTLGSDVVRAGQIAINQPSNPIRAGDALHLAIASRIGVTHFVSFDSDQLECAKSVLIGVELLGVKNA